MFRRACGWAIAVLFVAVSCSPALCWGGKGHRIVGAVADLVLEEHPKTQAKVKEILGGDTLATVSVWADCAKGFRYCNSAPTPEEKTYANKNPHHHNFHYTDIPYQQPKYVAGTAGSGSDDVVQVMKYAIAVLRGQAPANGPAKLDQREALWVLVHLVGDIHQPLHVASLYYDKDCGRVVDPNVVGAGQENFGIGKTVSETTGGNDLMKGSDNLHHYWDSTTVDNAMKLAGVSKTAIGPFAEYLVAHPPKKWKTTGGVDTWPEKWATEIMPVGRQAFDSIKLGEAEHPDEAHPTNLKCTAQFTFENGYDDWAKKQALQQLGKGGFRLANLLVAIFEPQ